MPLCGRNPSNNESCWNWEKRKEGLTENSRAYESTWRWIQISTVVKLKTLIISLKGFLTVLEWGGWCSKDILKDWRFRTSCRCEGSTPPRKLLRLLGEEKLRSSKMLKDLAGNETWRKNTLNRMVIVYL